MNQNEKKPLNDGSNNSLLAARFGAKQPLPPREILRQFFLVQAKPQPQQKLIGGLICPNILKVNKKTEA